MTIHATLAKVFKQRADGAEFGIPLVGVFGEGVPLPLVAALGGLAVDIKAPPLSDHPDGPHSEQIARIAEPFLDSFATRFLHRLAAGAFDRMAALIFARDDSAALAAYQYATELRRQGRIAKAGPTFHLWNLLRSDSPAAKTFNQHELARLTVHLEGIMGTTLNPDHLSAAVDAETRRSRALGSLPSGGPDAFVARNAGRWLAADDHAALLSDIPKGSGPAITLVGTACDIPVLHAVAQEFGHVRADLQDYGRQTPQPADAVDLLRQIAEDPLTCRAAPPLRFSRALEEGIKGSDLVIASSNTNDDCFGWELPGLRTATQTEGIRFLDLGFRPFRPDDAWQDHARTRIAEVLA